MNGINEKGFQYRNDWFCEDEIISDQFNHYIAFFLEERVLGHHYCFTASIWFILF